MKKMNSFTLIELIITIVIVAILAAIAIPMYTNAVEQRRGEACANNMRAILAAWRIYNLKNDPDYPPASSYRTIPTINNELGISISASHFGNPATGEIAFNFWLQSTFLRLLAYKLQSPNQGTYLYCRYYPNGTVISGNTYYYVWSSSTWPWPPENE